MKRTYKPEAKYYFDSHTSVTTIQEAYRSGKSVTGKVIGYDEIAKTLEVSLGDNIVGIMPWSEATIYQFTYPKIYEVENIPRQILSIMHKIIRAKVLGFYNGVAYLSRKENMLEGVKNIASSTNREVDAVIVGKYKYGAFFDIGEGIISFCHITNFSETRIIDLGSWVSIGELHKVALKGNFDYNDNYKIDCSRKEACPLEMGYNYYKNKKVIVVRIAEPIIQDDKVTGYFVEVNPRISGVVDIVDEYHTFRSGDMVTAVIKMIDPERRRIKLRVVAS